MSLKKLSKLKDKEINVAKEYLAFEVTKIVRGIEDADEALEIADNTFSSKIVDQRLPNITHNESDLKNNNFTILDAIEKLKLTNSRSEAKRLIKSDGIKVNDRLYKNTNFSLKEYSEFKEIKIAIGKKKIGILKIV